MPQSQNLVNDDEDVILDLRPHWSTLAKPAGAVTVSVLATIGLRRIDSYASVLGSAVAIGALVWFVACYLRWTKTRFILTTERIMYSTGILAKHAIKIPISRVNGVSYSQSALGHLVGTGDLSVQAGGVGEQGTFRRIPRPAVVQDEIYGQVMARAAKVDQGSTQTPAPPYGSVAGYQNGARGDSASSLSGSDAEALVNLVGLVEGYARSDLLPDGMAEQIRRRLAETGQMAPDGSVVRDVADALMTLGHRLRRSTGASREVS